MVIIHKVSSCTSYIYTVPICQLCLNNAEKIEKKIHRKDGIEGNINYLIHKLIKI